MPKGKKKGKSGGGSGRNSRNEFATSDEDSLNDTASIVSGTSDMKSVCEEGPDEVDEQSAEELLEDQLIAAIDGASEKSAQTRINSMTSIARLFSLKFVPDMIDGKHCTIADCIEKSLRKGKGNEQAAAAKLAALLTIQLESHTNYLEASRAALLQVMNNVSADPAARASCCTALGVSVFMGEAEMDEVILVIEAFESIFSKSISKADSQKAAIYDLYAAALGAWALLITIISAPQVYEAAPKFFSCLSELLQSPDVDLRICAGETIALLLEIVWNHDTDFALEDMKGGEEILLQLKQLSTDSNKYRAKKDRKQQRASFREIVAGVEEGEAPQINVRFGHEVLQLNSWRVKHRYDTLCNILGSGMNIHLAVNPLLRDLFDLGAPIPIDQNKPKISKSERINAYASNAKELSKTRNRSHDKRNAIMDY